jgi:hypothetical protein
MGSGVYIAKAIKKYGLENFKKEILFMFKDEKSALLKEIEIVNEQFVKSNKNYNISIGANTNCWKSMIGKVVVEDQEGKKFAVEKNDDGIKNGIFKLLWSGKKHSEKSKEKISFKRKELIKLGKIKPLFGEKNGMFGKKHSKEALDEMSESTQLKMTDEYKKYLSNKLKGKKPWNTGKKLTHDHKEKIKKSMLVTCSQKKNYVDD